MALMLGHEYVSYYYYYWLFGAACVVIQVLHGVCEVWCFCYSSRSVSRVWQPPVSALLYMPAACMLYISDFCYTHTATAYIHTATATPTATATHSNSIHTHTATAYIHTQQQHTYSNSNTNSNTQQQHTYTRQQQQIQAIQAIQSCILPSLMIDQLAPMPSKQTAMFPSQTEHDKIYISAFKSIPDLHAWPKHGQLHYINAVTAALHKGTNKYQCRAWLHACHHAALYMFRI